MNSFTYYAPTQVYFKEDGETMVGSLVNQFGYKKVLIHFGGGSVVRSGLLERVEKSLTQAGVSYVTLGGAVPNPLLSKVYEGIALAKKEEIDLILCVGGGSTIDSGKAIGMGLCYDGDVWDLFEGKCDPVGCVPIASVLTLAATGSEMSSGSVITKDEGMLKRHTGHDDARCKFAIMNPSLTLTLPDYQTASGCVDIIMHTMERYFNNTHNLDINDEMAEGVLRSTIRNAKILVDHPDNLEARWNVMWAGSLSHNGLTGCGVRGGDWATHDIEHELGGMFDVAHGAGLSAVWGSWARYVVEIIPHRFAKYGVNVLGIAPKSTELETAHEAIRQTEALFSSLKMPTNLPELGITVTSAQIDELAEKGTHYGKKKLGSVKPLDKSDLIAIYTEANKPKS